MISVIVHNWNRSFLIPLFIKSYCRQDLKETGEKMEMIIVDDNSFPEDNFKQYLNLALNTYDIKENLWFDIKAFINKDSYMNSGRTANVGVKQSKGDILIFNHTDIFPMHKYTLSSMHNRHKEHNKEKLYNEDMLYLTSLTLTNDSVNALKNFTPDCNGDTPWASAISRKLFYKVGGFDERFKGYGHEDADFGWRIKYGARELGCIMIYDPSIMFIHLQQSNMISLPPYNNQTNAELVNDNLTYNHRYIVNNGKEDEWGISKDIEEIKI